MIQYSLPKTSNFERKFGDKKSHLFLLQNRTGMQIALTDYGARLVSALIPNKHGDLIDVVLGFDSIGKYIEAQEQYHGATIGQVCNRIANGKFSIKDKEYILTQNNGNNALHGGPKGFHTKIWDRQTSFRKRIDFYYISPDNEEGFPGNVTVNVSYELTDDNEIVIKYKATTDKDTILNLTNHAYFNLNGEGREDILNHYAQINAKYYLPINHNQIPIGEIASVQGTVFDFTKPKKIGLEIDYPERQLQNANGYDHSFLNDMGLIKPVALAHSLDSGIQLEVFTDLPTIHFYTGNYLANDIGKSGKPYLKNGGFCFEAQHFIDSPNQKNFPNIILEKDSEYQATIIYKFNILK